MAVVVTVVLGVSPWAGGPQGSPAAAAVLTRAAEAALVSDEPGPDQYLYVREVTTRWSQEGAETSTAEHWISGDWLERYVYLDPTGIVAIGRSSVPAIYRQPDLTTSELLSWLRRPSGDLRGDDAAYERAGEILASHVAPPAFQSALFRVLPSIDGVGVVEEDATFGDAHVVVIGRGEPLESQFAFDKESGLFVGLQGSADPSVGSRLSYQTIMTTAVVSHLPPRAREV